MDTDRTIQFLKEALVDEPDNIDLRIKLASAYVTAKDYDKAKKQIEIILSKDPENEKAKQFKHMMEDEMQPAKQEEIVAPETSEDENKAVAVPSESMEEGGSSVREWFEKAKITFEDVGGMNALKEEIRVGIVYPFERPEIYEKYGKKIGGGILLYGPPGCGKTHIARATAGEIKAMFLSVGIDDILDMWMGNSEKKVHRLFEGAREVSPTVIFIDEVDALGANRMKVSASASTLVNQLLTEMDGMQSNNDKVMVIGATNTPWHVDPAFRRPGRFDKIIFVPPPDEVARAEVFKIHLRGKPVENIDYLELAKRTRGFSGADIAKVCDSAVEVVLREVLSGGKDRNVGMNDFLKVIQQTIPTTKEWFMTAKNFARYANESGTYSPILTYMKENGLE